MILGEMQNSSMLLHQPASNNSRTESLQKLHAAGLNHRRTQIPQHRHWFGLATGHSIEAELAAEQYKCKQRVMYIGQTSELHSAKQILYSLIGIQRTFQL